MPFFCFLCHFFFKFSLPLFPVYTSRSSLILRVWFPSRPPHINMVYLYSDLDVINLKYLEIQFEVVVWWECPYLNLLLMALNKYITKFHSRPVLINSVYLCLTTCSLYYFGSGFILHSSGFTIIATFSYASK